MCNIRLLRTKLAEIDAINVREEGDEPMSFTQIQYYDDCIRAYASKNNTPIDIAFGHIESQNLLPIIEESYKSKAKVFVAVRRLQAVQA